MVEGLPGKKNTEDRKKAARQIRYTRKYERYQRDFGLRQFGYEVNRSADKYIAAIGGLEELFKYLRARRSTKVLDIGSGTGKAIDGISESNLGEGFDFVRTALTKNLSPEGTKKVHLTSAEILRGIPSNSFGAVLAVCSVGYSEAPELVAEQIDRVLVPGGVFKGVFADSDAELVYGKLLKFKNYTALHSALHRRGYDTAVLANFPYLGKENDPDHILLAIKPDPSSDLPLAISLLGSDYEKTTQEKFIR